MNTHSTLRHQNASVTAATWEYRDGTWFRDGSPRARPGPLLRLAGWLAATMLATFMLVTGGLLFLSAAVVALPFALWMRWRTGQGLR